jgi:hypothetical protein
MYGKPGQVPSYDNQLEPLGRPRNAGIYTPGVTPLTLLAAPVTQPPFTPAVDPAPLEYQRLRDYTHNWSTVLRLGAGQDTIYGAPGEAPAYDWQLPPRAPQRARDYTWLSVAPIYVGQDSIFAAPGQVPTYDLQLAPRGVPRLRDYSWVSVAPIYVGQDAMYGAPGQAPGYDWQLPKPYRRVVGYGHTSATVLFLGSGQDSLYGGPGQVATYDWQRPPRAAGRSAGLYDQLTAALSILIVPNPQPPFTPSAEPNPRPAARLREYTHDWSTVLWLGAGQDSVYGAIGQVPAYDNQLAPRGLSRSAGLYDQWPTALTLLVVPPSSGPPFTPSADPNPRAYPRAVDYSWTWPLQQVLLGLDSVFGAQGQVPSYDNQLAPRGASRLRDYTYIQSLLLVLLGQDSLYGAPGQVGSYDWQLPLPARRLRDYTHIDGRRIPLVDALYGAAGQVPTYDWQLPIPARRLREYTHLLSTVLWLGAGQDSMYGAPGQVPSYDWRVPAAYRRPLLYVAELNSFLGLVLAAAPAVRDWFWLPGLPRSAWLTGSPASRWQSGIPASRWRTDKPQE